MRLKRTWNEKIESWMMEELNEMVKNVIKGKEEEEVE
jgi:hypothetical protein